jgi:predicted kinase
MNPAQFVIVSGPPASGKSTLAPPLARQLSLPLVAKDTIKEALMSEIPTTDRAMSIMVGRGAIAVMYAVAAESPVGAVVECNFHRSLALESLAGLPGPIVEVFCRCARATAEERYRLRAGGRHPGHFDTARPFDDVWNDEVIHPVAGGWPVIEVDTNVAVDVGRLVAQLRSST